MNQDLQRATHRAADIYARRRGVGATLASAAFRDGAEWERQRAAAAASEVPHPRRGRLLWDSKAGVVSAWIAGGYLASILFLLLWDPGHWPRGWNVPAAVYFFLGFVFIAAGIWLYFWVADTFKSFSAGLLAGAIVLLAYAAALPDFEGVVHFMIGAACALVWALYEFRTAEGRKMAEEYGWDD